MIDFSINYNTRKNGVSVSIFILARTWLVYEVHACMMKRRTTILAFTLL